MTEEKREPTRDELLAMAYVDGELDEAASRELEERMPHEPALAREVAELRKLAVLARRMAPPEPMDHEWARLESEFLHTGGSRLGLFLAAVGVVAGSGALLAALFVSEATVLTKVAAGLLLSGVTLLFLITLRGRLRTLPYDPYTEVKR